MIFSKEFDKSLWYILEADVENRNNIVNLIKSLPENFIAKISDSLKYVDNEYENGEKDLNVEFVYNKALDGFIYSFEIDTDWEEKNLNIKKELIDPSDLGCDGVNFTTELYLTEIMKEYPDVENEIANFSYYVSLISKHQKLKPDFTPYIKLENEKVKHFGQSKKYEYEYSLSKSGKKVTIDDLQIQSEPVFVSINSDKIPNDLTMTYIDNKYSNLNGNSFLKK